MWMQLVLSALFGVFGVLLRSGIGLAVAPGCSPGTVGIKSGWLGLGRRPCSWTHCRCRSDSLSPFVAAIRYVTTSVVLNCRAWPTATGWHTMGTSSGDTLMRGR